MEDILARRQWADLEDRPDDDYTGWATFVAPQSRTPSGLGSEQDQEEDDKSLPIPSQSLELPPCDPSKLSPDDLRKLMDKIPVDSEGQPTSLGSMHHSARKCNPCLYFCTPAGCPTGVLCTECHIPHIRKNGYRPCKAKRDRQKMKAAREASNASLPSELASASTGENTIPSGSKSVPARH